MIIREEWDGDILTVKPEGRLDWELAGREELWPNGLPLPEGRPVCGAEDCIGLRSS